jgi:hypothetical protein
MVRVKGSRWDVGTKDNVITLERFDDGDECISEDVLEVEEARELAALLTKHADKLASSDKDDSNNKDDSNDKDNANDKDHSNAEADSEKDDSGDDSSA